MSHNHELPESGKRLAVVVGLNLLITVAEVIGGLISGSLSLLSDALHNFSDGIAVIIAWIAMHLHARARSDTYTFGLKRAEVVAAVINAGALVAISIFLFVEAWQRFHDPQPISGVVMTAVASVGLVANVLGTWLLHRGSKTNMNLRAAYLHLFSDAISSIGVIIGGLAITFYGITWIDPLLTVLIGLYVLAASLRILWRAAEHDTHFEAHISVSDQRLSEANALRQDIEQMLHERFDINHATLQLEASGSACATQGLP